MKTDNFSKIQIFLFFSEEKKLLERREISVF